MNLYMLKNNANTGYDTYDSCVVAANSECEARVIHPDHSTFDDNDYNPWEYNYVWAPKEDVEVTLIGESLPSQEKGVIITSFNAG